MLLTFADVKAQKWELSADAVHLLRYKDMELSIPVVDSRIKYVTVVDQPNKSADELYDRAKAEIDSFFNINNVTFDGQTNTIVAKVNSHTWSAKGVGLKAECSMSFVVKMEFRDERFRISIFDFYGRTHLGKRSSPSCGSDIEHLLSKVDYKRGKICSCNSKNNGLCLVAWDNVSMRLMSNMISELASGDGSW